MSSEDYFDAYSPIQAHKHALIRRYLGAWYPKLASWSGKVLYLETHAGRGAHKGGQLGSPLVAIQTLFSHPRCAVILQHCEIHFVLMEIKEAYALKLTALANAERRHPNVTIRVEQVDFSKKLHAELDRMESTGKAMAPAFVFMDPFGYQIPIDLVRRVLKHPSCEVMLTFMAQPVARAVRDGNKDGLLDLLYGKDAWRSAKGVQDFEDQKGVLVTLYEQAVGARWSTKLRLTGQTDYTLMHFTNHPDGRATMKRTLWALTEKFGKAGASQLLVRDDPNQGTLIVVDPDLTPLEGKLKADFFGRCFTYAEALTWLLPLDFVETHLHKVLATGRRDGWLETEHKRSFGPSMGCIPMKIIGGSLL